MVCSRGHVRLLRGSGLFFVGQRTGIERLVAQKSQALCPEHRAEEQDLPARRPPALPPGPVADLARLAAAHTGPAPVAGPSSRTPEPEAARHPAQNPTPRLRPQLPTRRPGPGAPGRPLETA